MFDNNQKDYNHLTISYELIALLQWLIKHEPRKMKRIIQHALQNGLQTIFEKTNISRKQLKLSLDRFYFSA